MKITTYEKTTELEFDEQSYKTGPIDVAELVRALRVHSAVNGAKVDLNAAASGSGETFAKVVVGALRTACNFGTALSLAASATDEAPREVTGEDIYALVAELGGTSVIERDPDTGEITSIHASVTAGFDDTLASVHAAGPTPQKLTGDLAQTSVGTTGSETQVVGLAEWTIDWKRKTADATTTDNSTYESSLGSTASWSVKSKYMFIDGDTSQATYILATIQTPQQPMQWNFFPTIATGRAAFNGLAYVDGITLASGMGKVVALDVSLKGTGPLNIAQQITPVANPNTVTGQTAEV